MHEACHLEKLLGIFVLNMLVVSWVSNFYLTFQELKNNTRYLELISKQGFNLFLMCLFLLL